MRIVYVGAVLAVILGCAGAGKDSETDPMADGDGVDQAEACADYLDCLAAVDPTTLASVQATYGAAGTCWADADSAEQCAAACETGLAQMNEAHPDEDACDTSGAIDAYDIDGAWSFVGEDTERNCGLTVGIDAMDVQLGATGEDAFDFEGDVTFTVEGESFNTPVNFSGCSFDGEDLDCPDTWDGRWDTFWTFSGAYSGGGIDATVGIGYGDGEGGIDCTDYVMVRGER